MNFANSGTLKSLKSYFHGKYWLMAEWKI